MAAPLCELGEKIVDALERPSRHGKARSRGRDQVLLDREGGKDLPTLGNQAEACLRDPIGRQPDERDALEGGTSAAGGQQTHEGANGGGLAHSIAAEERDDFARSDAQADVEQHLRRAVGGLQMIDCEHPPHSISSPR